MRRIWYEMTLLAYHDRPELPWEERHIKVTLGESKVDTVYEFLNPKPKSHDGVEYITRPDFTQIHKRKNLKDIDVNKIDLSGICGKFETIMSEDRNEFKIEFL